MPRRLRALAAHLQPAPSAATEAATTTEIPRGGLFFEDYSILPTLTNDMPTAKRDIDVFGYCLWANAIDSQGVVAMAQRIVDQAEAEVRVSAHTNSPPQLDFRGCF